MKRWFNFLFCITFSLAMLVGGWMMPAHLRAVDSTVILRAGINTPALVNHGLVLVREKKPGAAELLLQAAQMDEIYGHEQLRWAIAYSYNIYPELEVLGVDPRLEILQKLAPKNPEGRKRAAVAETNGASNPPTTDPISKSEPFTELVVQSANRDRVFKSLHASTDPVVQELLRSRSLTNTVLFPASQSSAGQAFDTALSICGLLIESRHLTTDFTGAVFSTATAALRGGSPEPLEQILLDLMSLGQRLNWGQLVAFCVQIEDPKTLHLLANAARKADSQLPVIFSAVEITGQPAAVAKYLANFPATGQKDLRSSLPFGAGGVTELLERNQRLYLSKLERLVGLDFCWRTPHFALTLKWFLFLASGFMLAVAMRVVRKPLSPLEQPLNVRELHLAREILFALGFLFVVLLLNEPFLAQESQKAEVRLRLQIPMVGKAIATENAGAKSSIMNHFSLLTLLLFFVLQLLLYVACLVKLAEVRRQKLPARVKLKLLENEDHLFDAGLYLGFAGTIISLILVSMGIIKPSLMAAYSSTSFGVIFVSIFKIFNLRPFRRRMLLESEAAANPSAAPGHEHKLAAPL